jgi:hypothetical protein
MLVFEEFEGCETLAFLLNEDARVGIITEAIRTSATTVVRIVRFMAIVALLELLCLCC